jgi:L-amino acid N-acyltransferase YncA
MSDVERDDPPMTQIRPAKETDWNSIWTMFQAVVRHGDAFVYESIENDEAFSIWFGPDVSPFVAEEKGEVVGAYYLRPNFPGRGRHVANASYVVGERSRGRGIGRSLGVHSVHAAVELGYAAIQFNCVVATNDAAIRLWGSLGFRVIGTVPQALQHVKRGAVDVMIMHRSCDNAVGDASVGDASCVTTGATGLLDRLLQHDVWTHGTYSIAAAN